MFRGKCAPQGPFKENMMKLLAVVILLLSFLMIDVTHVHSMGNQDDTTLNSAKKDLPTVSPRFTQVDLKQLYDY